MKRQMTQKQALAALGTVLATGQRLQGDLPELYRRMRFNAGNDGYPSSTRGGSGGGDISDPTAIAAIAPTQRDIVAETIRNVIDDLNEITRICERIDGARAMVMNIGESERGRQSSLDSCNCCDRTITNAGDDRRRSGYCPACFKAWRRFMTAEQTEGREASRTVFETRRREQMRNEAVA